MSQGVFQSRIILLAAILFLTAFTITGTSCSILNRDKQSKAEKKTEEADKKADAEYENARKQHYNHQTKETKKMMKQTEKQAAKYNNSRKRKALSSTKCR